MRTQRKVTVIEEGMLKNKVARSRRKSSGRTLKVDGGDDD
jgi:hypothetical protein